MYDVPNRRMVEHRVPGRGYLKLGALRAPLDPPYFFAQEGMMDELAYLAKLDPHEFRKRNISHPRWLGVLKAVADAAKWTPRVAASTVTDAKIAVGRGIALGTHHLIPNQGDRITFAAAVWNMLRTERQQLLPGQRVMSISERVCSRRRFRMATAVKRFGFIIRID